MIATGSDEHSEGIARRVGQLIVDTAHNAPRSTQVAIGPSEIGDVCERKLTYKLLDWPTVDQGDPIASVIGTGMHSWMEDAFRARQSKLPDGRDRYKIESRVTVRTGPTPASTITGSADLFDRLTGTNLDWKLTGVSSLDKYRRQGPHAAYHAQAHLYGMGQANAGEDVKRVAIVFIGRHHELRVHVWSEPYREDVARAALQRLDRITARAMSTDFEAEPHRWAEVPTDEKAACRFCPWLRSGSTDLATGCPGVGSTRPGASLSALIA
ncbi:PD-(D/E)XK nuclease family protein [Streptomyces bohaiensis]|uniref:PD-(D/E)XK endonuclease-like domain-containing protein n=1 Tax=Streptomyces bohaiensis TaxID=1431344 RepID=A0ABX1C4P6_9ACTN|nr:PD-(D/E)XK nuclease family protein [Streptomyces bohaiensis]NJQ14191.1 hypothetical protein [Streptomyces bohaiensis]